VSRLKYFAASPKACENQGAAPLKHIPERSASHIWLSQTTICIFLALAHYHWRKKGAITKLFLVIMPPCNLLDV